MSGGHVAPSHTLNHPSSIDAEAFIISTNGEPYSVAHL